MLQEAVPTSALSLADLENSYTTLKSAVETFFFRLNCFWMRARAVTHAAVRRLGVEFGLPLRAFVSGICQAPEVGDIYAFISWPAAEAINMSGLRMGASRAT